MESSDRAFLSKSNRIIVGEIINTLRAQGNPSGVDDHISSGELSPVASGKYAIIPSISIGIMDYGEFYDAIGEYEESGLDNSKQNAWNTVGAVGLDAIFAPYTTETEASRSPFLPRFTSPSGTSDVVTSTTLNPFNIFNSLSGISHSGHSPDNDPWFSGGHNISMALTYNPYDSGVNGSGGFVGSTGIYPSGSGSPVSYIFEEDHFARRTVETQGIRAVGLKTPLVLSGPGYDIDGNPVPASGDSFHPEAAYNPSLWKTGPLDIRWDEPRGVWTGGNSTKIYLVKMTNAYTPSSFSYEVDRSNSRSQYSRNAPPTMKTYSANQAIYDPEAVAYNANPQNVGNYEQLDYSNLEFPFYEAFIIRQTNEDPTDSTYYNIWTDDCQDCGPIQNQCPSGDFPRHESSGNSIVGKKILIENPLRQSMDVGDLAFTVRTGRSKNVNTGRFVDGSGIGASGIISVNSSGYATFSVTSSGSGYTYGGFGIPSGNICTNISLFFNDSLSSGVLTPSGTFASGNYPVAIYPTNATVETERLDIHWIMQAEFKSQQVVTHVECDNGILQSCSIKVQTQGMKSCEYCGEDTSFINN